MKTDAIIVGSGIIGMSLAIILSRNNKKTIIIEKNLSNNLNNRRVYALSEKTKSFFESISIWENISNINQLDEMSLYYRDYITDDVLSFKRIDSQKNIGYIGESNNIMKALIEKIEHDKNIKLYDNCSVDEISNHLNNLEIITTDKNTIKSKYLFSCDGSKSNIKKHLGLDNQYDYYDSKAKVFNIKHEKSNNNTATQIFLQSGPVAFLPLTLNESSMVVSIKNKFNYEEFSEDNICGFLEKITNNSFGKIELNSKILSFDLVGFDSESYISGNTVFVGDSAHSVHPLAGMGLNLGISDVIEIDKAIKGSHQIFGDKNFFSGYARKQKIVNKKARQQLKIIEKVYSLDNNAIMQIIKFGMKNIQKSTFLKEKIIKHANNNLSIFQN